MQGEELFDATLLEQTIVSLIEKGRRNIAIYLGGIEYIYSDSINKIINLNHRILNVYGRLSILSPSKPVSQILHRAGIQNFIKIYISEDELKKASDEMIQQTTSISIKDIEAMQRSAQPQPKLPSEFEDLRSEIGRAIDKGTPGRPEESSFQQQDAFFAPPKQQYQQQTYQQPAFAPPEQTPQFEFGYQPQPGSFTAPMAKAPVFDSQQMFSQPPAQGFTRPAPQPRQEQKKAPAFGQIQDKFPSAQGRKIERREMFEDDDDFLEKNKKSSAPLVTIIVALLVILGGAVYFYISQQSQTDTTTMVQPEPRPQQIPVAQPQQPLTQPAQPVESAVPQTTTPEPQPVASTVPPKPEPQAPAVTRTREPVAEKKQPRREERVTRSAPREQPAKKQPVERVGANKLTITSFPSGANIVANGTTIGITPFTWENPEMYGMISLTISKDDYSPKTAVVEYTGGTVKKHFDLGDPARSQPSRQSVQSPETQYEESPVAQEQEAEPERAAPQNKPAAKAPVPEPVATPEPISEPDMSEASSGGGGEEATIFISSLPPMAEVYLDGKKIGTTNIAELKVASGQHTMRFVKGDKEDTRQMTFSPGKNPSQLIRLK